ncbi:pilus assembly protein [Pseudogulbenkiania subflava]|uniref:Type IV pilus assembly protein PilY1 n=1 Tax=Pseudogulbenkiania subflava DSM 22618 TaxID=1123014 RepID=A0A1Y6C2G1_9NEIS|nr:PilC/PilY family type IV pilus protein [Pseudogulbenkiania subflava]SMF42019.1 type IV pilus assembly protein PilY1 [Pseudogulbenkiania subflava DSM 22618]
MFTAKGRRGRTALAAALAMVPLLAQADSTTTLPDYPLEVCASDTSQSGAAAAVTNSNIVQGDSTMFASYYNYNALTGALQAFSIDPATGAIIDTNTNDAIVPTPLWTAATSTSRTVYGNPSGTATQLASSLCDPTVTTTSNGNGGTQTSTPSLWLTYLQASTQQECSNIISKLLGSTSTVSGLRSYAIGTIIHSEPVYVSGLQRLFQPANDGMLHAFYTVTGGSGQSATTAGNEAWAYIPKAFLASVGQTEAPKIDTYVRSTYTTHKYWLDSTPVIEPFSTKTTSGNQTTTNSTYYLASGFGKGAKGVYSIQVGTNQTTVNSSNNNTSTTITSQPTSQWTFNSTETSTDSNAYVGYLYGRPIITQLNDSTTSPTKVAIFAGGFSNTDIGSGINCVNINYDSSIANANRCNISNYSYLFVIDLSTGLPIQRFRVEGKGLNKLAGFADSYSSLNQIKYVYGGDLDGNVWRFDLTGTPGSWPNPLKLASLSKPITSEPELAEIDINGSPKRFVYVGTGRYLTPSDVDSGDTGAMYGLIDRVDDSGYTDASATIPSQLSTISLAQSTDTSSSAYTGSTAINPNNVSTYGWLANLPTGQRVINAPALANGKVLFTANKPASACTNGTTGMESWLYAIDYKTGFQTAYYTLSNASANNNFLASRPTIVKLSTGEYKALIRSTDGDTIKVDLGNLLSTSGGTGSTVKGVFWREVITQ